MSDPVSTFYISRTLGNAWSIFKKQWMQVLGVFVVMMLINIVLNQAVKWSSDGAKNLIPLFSFLSAVVSLVIGTGFTKFMLNVARQQPAQVKDLTSAAPYLIKYFLGVILYSLMVLVGLILLILPGLYLMVKYMYIPYLIVDKGLGPIAAMKMSGQMTKGIKFDLVASYIAISLVMYAGILALGVGLLVTIPVGIIATLMIYDMALQRVETQTA